VDRSPTIPRRRLRIGADDRRIAALAIPALGALAAEPLYVLVDTGIVGHLGVSPLAGLALAGGVLSAVVSLCNFLEYGSTPKVGRLFAVGDRSEAAHLGRQATILGFALGLMLAVVAIAAAPLFIAGLGGHGRVGHLAVLYTRIASLGLPSALIAVAAQGYFRGVARLRLPFAIVLGGNLLNALLELWFVDRLHWGIAGSAWGTVIAQTAMAGVFVAVLDRDRRRERAAPRRPVVDRVVLRSLTRTGAEIFVRTGSLYTAFLLAGAILARVGAASLAAHQIAFQLWNFLALALDSLAIAAQVMVSHQLALGDRARARALATRTIGWSLVVGIAFAILFLALRDVLPEVFSSDPRVLGRARAVWPIFALMQPLNALVFALDGILIGAGDTRYLMWAMVPASAIGFAPLAVASLVFGWGIVGVWCAIVGLVVVRLVLNGRRFLGEAWTHAVADQPSVSSGAPA
jgi:putative MATE family efflux protein